MLDTTDVIALFHEHLQSLNIILWIGVGIVTVIMITGLIVGQIIINKYQTSKINEIVNSATFEKVFTPYLEKYLSDQNVLDNLRKKITINNTSTVESSFEDDIPF